MTDLNPLHLTARSEEHTSELQSHSHLVCRLLLEKKKRTGAGSLRARPTSLVWCARPVCASRSSRIFFFFNDPAPPEISPLSLPDAFPIFERLDHLAVGQRDPGPARDVEPRLDDAVRSEEHTSELQSHSHLVCRLLLE